MLGSDPSGQQIWDEFAANSKPTKPAGTVYSLGDAHEKIFGAGAHNRLDHANTGQPIGDTVSARVTGATTADLKANIEVGGVTTEYYFEYGKGNFNSDTLPAKSISADDLVVEGITGLTEGQEYQFRVVFWNAYNNATADRKVGTTQTFTPEASYTTPYNLNVSQLGFTEPVTVEATWDNATSAGMDIEWRKNGVFDTSESLAGNTTSRQRGTYVNGDTVSFRLRYTSGDTSWTDWVGTSIFTSS